MNNILFRNKYRIPSARMPGWDYGRGGAYCVTICTRNRVCYFGDVVDQKIVHSPIGQIVGEQWAKTSELRSHVKLDVWIVMPNHLHGILFIHPPHPGEAPRPLGVIIGSFKSTCTSLIWKAGWRDFAWQERYYDQVIRDEETLNRFRKYIVENPVHWEKDKHHPNAAARQVPPP